jgi:drug/metabolite transporter (DMT)-like permease
VLRVPTWLFGFTAVIAGFLLQAAALNYGAISVVEPVLVVELPFTLLLAGLVFRRRPSKQDYFAAVVMSVGVAGVLYALAPRPHPGERVAASAWLIGSAANIAVVALLYVKAQHGDPQRRALLLGIATGAAFGLTVAFMKSMTTALSDGIVGVLTTWQTYAMAAAGLFAMALLQGALNAGSLVAAQPGITLLDPLVSAGWGIFAYDEQVRTGGYLIVAAIGALVLVAGVVLLARSPLLHAVSSNGSPSGPSPDPAPDAAADTGGDSGYPQRAASRR